MNRLIIRILILFSVAITGLFLIYFSIRNKYAEEAILQKTNNYNKNHEAQIAYGRVHFKGIKTISIDSLLFTSAPSDTLVYSESISANINVLQLLSRHIRFRKLILNNTSIILNDSTIKNYDKFLAHKSEAATVDSIGVNYQNKVETILRRLFGSIPPKLALNNVKVDFQKDTARLTALIGQFSLKHGKLETSIEVSDNNTKQIININGKIKRGKRLIGLEITPADENTEIQGPLAKIFGFDIRYKSIDINFSESSNKDNVSKLNGEFIISKFDVNHPSLSSRTVSFPGSSMNFSLEVGSGFITLDSISEISLGELSMHPYINYKNGSENTLEISCYLPEFTAQSFFTSIPHDLFTELKSIEAEGSLSYRAKMNVDFALPDSLKLESKLYKNNFKIISIDDGLKKMNTSFIHTVYEKGIPKRQILVGPGNPNFCGLGRIPKLLQTTVLFAEDDAFFYSNGFSLGAMQRALALDIKEKRFARGGSTISMQLIKNVYLSREKTFSRKLEEIILVWLIESNRLVSKARMYEVYLNIIEWGPNVYGAAEASRFYFSKDISQLNPTECIFLASVIPSPKKFYFRFDKEGNMAQFEKDYYIQMSERLAKWGHIPSANADSLISLLKITGPAKNYLRTSLSAGDTISLEENFDYPDE